MKYYDFFLLLAVTFLLTAAGLSLAGGSDYVAPCIILFSIFLAFSFRGYEALKSYTYTVMILGAVTMALYYPH